MKILITGDNASTRFGGEAILPYHYFRLLNARDEEAWLVTHARCKKELTTAHPELSDKMEFIEDSSLELFLFKMESLSALKYCANWLRYLIFQIKQRKKVRELVRRHNIDLVHQVVPVSPKLPSLLFNVGAPVVIGPMNGGMNYPPGFSNLASRSERFSVWLGRLVSNIANVVIPGKRRADLLLVANERTLQALPDGCFRRTAFFIENGIYRNDLPFRINAGEKQQNIRFGFLGHLVPLKGIQYLIAAHERMRNADTELHIIGDGVFRTELEKRAKAARKKIHFHGMIDWKDVPGALANLDVFVFPSLKDCGGAVLMEAMAAGLPIISTAWGGPLDYLDSGCAIFVEPHDEEQFVADFASAMDTLADSPERRQVLGASGKKKALTSFTWESKIDRILDIYRGLCSKM